MARELPCGVQDFAKLRERGMVYIDKTAYLLRLVHTGKPYFLARPRRFGKSLLVSTLKVFWEGRRELFEGLQIYDLESARPDAWTPRAVFHLNLDGADYTVPGALEAKLDETLRDWEEVWGGAYSTRTLAGRFAKLLEVAHRETGHRAVALVDEYDKPLLDAVAHEALVERNRGVLRGFYGVLKEADEHLESVFVTGVTRFSKVSIFSDMNNLTEISLDEDYAGICGITEDEIARFLAPDVKLFAARRHMSLDQARAALREQYDGYCFHPEGPEGEGAMRVYNPYSLMRALASKSIGSYWFDTGTPTFLTRRIVGAGMDARALVEGGVHAGASYLMSYRAENPDPVPLLFQTGYLTIRGYDERRRRYALGVPNGEVSEGLLTGLLAEYAPAGAVGGGCDIYALDDCIESGDTDGMRDILAALFASIPYTTAKGGQDPFEYYFQAVIYVTFLLLSKWVEVETHVAGGRVDVVVGCESHVYVMELKRDGTATEALAQIEERGYALRYAADARILHRIGCSFDSSTRLLAEWEAV